MKFDSWAPMIYPLLVGGAIGFSACPRATEPSATPKPNEFQLQGDACGSENPNLGYGGAPYGGSWATDHRDGRNSDFADCEISGRGFYFSWSLDIEEPHSNYVYPTIGPDGTAWTTIHYDRVETDETVYIFGVDLKTSEIRVEIGVPEQIHYSVSWNPPVIDQDGNIYLTQEKAREPTTPCRYAGEPVTEGRLCGEAMSFDKDGNERWRVSIDGATLGLQLTQDGNVVFQTWRGSIYVLDPNPVLPNPQRVLAATNTFPEKAATLPDYHDRQMRICFSMGLGDDCITGNIIAIHPNDPQEETTGPGIYNTVQGFVLDQQDSFLQRWNYDPLTHQITLDNVWDSSAPLPGGSASSSDIAFTGEEVFVNDFETGIYALDAQTGMVLDSADIGYPVGGSPGTSPEIDVNGDVIGSYVVPFGPGTRDAIGYVTVLGFRRDEGFRLIKVFDGSDGEDNGVAWRVARDPVGGINDKSAVAPNTRYVVIGQKECASGCVNDELFHLLEIEAATGELLSATPMAGDGITGLFSLAPDGAIILNSKGRPSSPEDDVLQLIQRYDPLAPAALDFGDLALTGTQAASGAELVRYQDQIHAFTMSLDGEVLYTPSISRDTPWVSLGGSTASAPAAVAFQRALWVFVRGVDDRLYYNRLADDFWAGWELVPVPNGFETASAPTVAVHRRLLYLFARGSDDLVHYTTLADGLFGNWNSLSAETTAAPAAGTLVTGAGIDRSETLYLMTKDGRGRLFARTLSDNGVWSEGELVLGTTLSRPTLVPLGNKIWAFARGSHDQVYYTYRAAEGWRHWALGPGVTTDIAGAAVNGEQLYLSIKNPSNRLFYGIGTEIAP